MPRATRHPGPDVGADGYPTSAIAGESLVPGMPCWSVKFTPSALELKNSRWSSLAPVFAQRIRPYFWAYSRWRRRPSHQGTVVSGRSALRRTGE